MIPKKRTTTTKHTGGKNSHRRAPSKVFISYCHRDERYKNELVTMLKGLENQNVITVWQDRQIEPGQEWLKEIKSAMRRCRMALLLVSQYFLASAFIQTQEVPRLLQQRMENGLIVIPIIIRPCLWARDPVLQHLQALPRDAKPIASYSRPCKRDQIWADIAEAIERQIR